MQFLYIHYYYYITKRKGARREPLKKPCIESPTPIQRKGTGPVPSGRALQGKEAERTTQRNRVMNGKPKQRLARPQIEALN